MSISRQESRICLEACEPHLEPTKRYMTRVTDAGSNGDAIFRTGSKGRWRFVSARSCLFAVKDRSVDKLVQHNQDANFTHDTDQFAHHSALSLVRCPQITAA